MRGLFRVVVVLGLIFTSLFVLMRFTGFLSLEDIRHWLSQAEAVSPAYVIAALFLLLFVDLYLAVPTTTVIVLGGYFLGWQLGFLGAAAGMLAAGTLGFVLSRLFGERVVRFIVRDADKREDMRAEFSRHGVWMILMSRAMPMLPEISACLAGATGMRFRTFMLAWSGSALPYALVVAYAGSRSSLDNPLPAILGVIGLSLALWVSWYLFTRSSRRATADASQRESGRAA